MLGQTTPLPDVVDALDQRVYLVATARNRRVLHLGCVDDGLTAARAGTGLLLHEELARTASALTGVDLSAEGVDLLRQVVPGDYVVGDIQKMDELDLPEADLVIAAEVIEHLPCPGQFLATLRTYLERTGATAIITTPSAYSWRALVTLLFQRKGRVHPDHLRVYTPITLRRAVEQAGLRITSYRVHAGSDRPRSRLGRAARSFDGLAIRINPFLAVGMVIEVVPDDRP